MVVTALKAFKDNYVWAVVSESDHTLFCVDPGESEPVLSFCQKNQFELSEVLITHHHYDHVGGLQELSNAYPALKIYGPKDDRIPLINQVVRDEDLIHIGEYDFRIISIPGHTSTHISFFEPSKHWLFCGDTLFSAGCGRVFDGSMASLFNSLKLISHLPDDTLIYCAHEYTRNNLRFAKFIEPENKMVLKYINHIEQTNDPCTLPSKLALEKEINPFLRTNQKAVIEFCNKSCPSASTEFEFFQCLREEKDHFI